MYKVTCRYCKSDNYSYDSTLESPSYTTLYCNDCGSRFRVRTDRLNYKEYKSKYLDFEDTDVERNAGFKDSFDLYDYYYRLYYDDDFDGDYEEYFADEDTEDDNYY